MTATGAPADMLDKSVWWLVTIIGDDGPKSGGKSSVEQH
jgi:hypothetical protein